MKVVKRSISTGIVRTRELPITQEQADAYESGVDISICMPHLSLADKMFFVSGITDEDWEEGSTVSVGHRLDK